MLVRHLKNTHFSLSFPGVFPIRPHIKGKCKFSDSCKYIFTDGNQGDWNKLTGIKHKLFNPYHTTAMVAWRYNNKTDLFELAPYFHLKKASKPSGYTEVGKYKGYTMPPVLSIKAGEWVEYEIVHTNKHYSVRIGSWRDTVSNNIRSTKHFRVKPWFGGDNPAPHNMKFWLV